MECIVCQKSFLSEKLLTIVVDPKDLSKRIKPSKICEACYSLSGIGALSKFEEGGSTAAVSNLKKTTSEKEETMNPFVGGESQRDKMNFAEHQQLCEKRSEIAGKQKFSDPDSIDFSRNKAALKKIDERLEELKQTIPEIYFRPEDGVRINKAVQADDPILQMPRLNLEALGTRIFALQDAISTAGPGQDVGIMRRDLQKLKDEFSIKAALSQPRRTDPRGFVRGR